MGIPKNKKVITIRIRPSWYNSNKQAFADPIGIILETCRRVFPEGLKIERSASLRCRLITEPSDDSTMYITRIIGGIVKDTLGLETVSAAALIDVRELSANDNALDGIDSLMNAFLEEQGLDSLPLEFAEKPAEVTVQDQIKKLIGAEDFKRLADEIISIAPQIKKHSTQRVFAAQSYLFSINDGCGLSTYVELFAQLLEELGIFKCLPKNKVVEILLPPPASDSFSPSIKNIEKRLYSGEQHLYCIDISEWMSLTTEKEFRNMLATLNSYSGDNIFVFRVPFVETDILIEIKRALSDLLFIREVSFTPFNTEQLERCAEIFLSQNGYSMSDDAREIFDTRIAEEKSDGRFYGINTVNKVASEMIYLKQLSNAKNSADNTVIHKSDILSLVTTYMQPEKSASEMLSELVGMEEVAKRVEEIITQITFSLSKDKISAPCLHMQFVGNPGTGKTTVARIVGKLLKENGVLRNGSFFEHKGRDFCGRFIGETAPKTSAICRDAYGSVLFVDEAYSLCRSKDNTRDFGREALDTLIAEMENHRHDLVIIMAGYSDEMETLMQANPGLRSRMPFVINFPNYTKQQLFDIFSSMLESSFSHDDQILPAAREYFFSISDKVINSKEFSNARFVRNLFERTWGKAAMRSRFVGVSEVYVTKEDFLQACAEKEFTSEAEKNPRSFGFRL